MSFTRPANGFGQPGYPTYYQQQQQQPMQMQMQPQVTDYDDSIVTVRNEQEILTYPVPVGKNQLFNIAGTNLIWEKQMGRSILEAATYTKYKIVKDEANANQAPPQSDGQFMPELMRLQEEVKGIRAELDAIKGAAMRPNEEGGYNG